LDQLRQRLAQRRVPAHTLIRQVEADPSVPVLLRYLDRIAEAADASHRDNSPPCGQGQAQSQGALEKERVHEVDHARK
jgi:hypothetical protein